MELRSYARVKAMVDDPDTDEDKATSHGASPAMITRVFENMERQTREGLSR